MIWHFFFPGMYAYLRTLCASDRSRNVSSVATESMLVTRERVYVRPPARSCVQAVARQPTSQPAASVPAIIYC